MYGSIIPTQTSLACVLRWWLLGSGGLYAGLHSVGGFVLLRNELVVSLLGLPSKLVC